MGLENLGLPAFVQCDIVVILTLPRQRVGATLGQNATVPLKAESKQIHKSARAGKGRMCTHHPALIYTHIQKWDKWHSELPPPIALGFLHRRKSK